MHSNSTSFDSSDSSLFGTLTSEPPVTLPPWLTNQSHAGDMTSDSSPLDLTPGQLRWSTRDASITGHLSTRSATVSGVTGGEALTGHTAPLYCACFAFSMIVLKINVSTVHGLLQSHVCICLLQV